MTRAQVRAAVVGLLIGTTPLSVRTAAAQSAAPGDTLLFEQALHGPVDTLRIRLQKGGQYRVGLWPGSAQLAATTQSGRVTAFAARTREGTGTSGTLVELYPPQSGEYLVIVSTSAGVAGGRVEVWADRKLAAARQEARDRSWGIGLSLAAELYSAYHVIEGYPDEGGTGVGGCLLVGSSGPFSACLGFDTQPREGEAGTITWYFLEPRYRILTAHALGRPFDFLATLRIGQGHEARLSVDPSLLAPGVIMAYHLDDRPGARGWRLTLQVYGAMIGNTALAQKPTYLAGAVGFSWIP